ncbi:MAG: serine/threonine-protein kinase [Treponema sp.]|nr:serine/threonine-protein kinase [Treponema sp.]
MADDFPSVIGKYKVLGIIAKGGMGVVYKAIHPSLKRYVVIKKMTARNKSGNAERFKKEAQILLDLQSPYIVHLFDYFTEDGYRYMVEELVDGMAVDNLITKQMSIPVPIAMLIMQDACYALKYAHSKDIVHRDIKPGNILISKRGEIKLADFGIASDSEEKENITATGVALGTPAYMPPEQFEDSANVDNRADIYALGIMLYEMVTGTKPYPGTFSLETLNTIKKGRYISPRKIDKTVPREVCSLIHKMIKPKAKKRYQSIDQVLKVVKKYLKHYDVHEIRVQLAKSVLDKKSVTFPKFEQKDKYKILFRKIFFSVLFVALLIFAGFKTGFFYRTIFRHWITPVNVEMVMPRALSEKMDLPMKAYFFENDNEKIPEVKFTRRTFAVKGSRFYEKFSSVNKKLEVSRPASKNKTYTMQSVYMKQGDYRVKVVVGPYVWWKSFSVGKEDVLLDCDFLKGMVRNLNITATAIDAETGKDITELCEFRVLYKNKWQLLTEVPAEELKSASVCKIKVSSEGYQEENYSLLIDWYQDNILISAALKK